MMASLGPALRNILPIRTVKARVARMIRPTMMATEFDISFLCPCGLEACVVLAAVGGWRESASASEAARVGRRFFSGRAVGTLVEGVNREFVKTTDVGDASLVADDDDLCAALDGGAVFTASGVGATGPSLREDDFAYAAVVANAVADVSEDAGHLGLFCGEDALVRKKQLEENRPEKRCAEKTTEQGQQQNQRRDEDAVAIKEVADSAEPAKEGGDGEAVDRREAVGAVVGVCGVPDVHAADMQMREAACDGED